MYKVTPSAPLHFAASAAQGGNCGIVDASTLLYRPASRAAIAQEQMARLATRLALARWTSSNIVATAAPGAQEMPFRAAFYAREQDQFLAWIGRGGVWEADAGEEANAAVTPACAGAATSAATSTSTSTSTSGQRR